jgi:GTP-binding protein HflX
MYENKEQKQIALLVCVDTGEFDAQVSIDELEELSYTAGAQVAGKVIQRRESLDPSTCVGSGRLEEIKEFCQANDVNLLIFDHELTAVQQRNIERETDLAVIDRTTLILDIFAQRARSKEGKLQVELAQQKYLLPRLMGLGQSLSRLGGGIGTRGPGESKLESDRRHIRRRIQSLEEQLEEVGRHRELLRRRRKKDGVITVAIVGYTNVGKSTLLNTLTDAGVLAEDKLFATLDPTARALKLPDGRSVMLVDTVGLIRRLPHHLVEAFHSTLEEAVEADLILNVCDISSEETLAQIETTRQVLQELGAGDKPVVTVLNKCDKLSQMPLVLEKGCVFISAKTGFGLEKLLEAIEKALPPTHLRLKLMIPFDKAAIYSRLKDSSVVYAEEYTAHGILVDALVDMKMLHEVEGFIE